ncbi:hypothetical protein GCM10025859_23250 [Alicyclobacillus fastidiosus]|nr:hypothetical protein GCM10025859_23250 [Alicyclobacillus fastidiosus]
MRFIQNLDVVIVAVWIFSVFVKLSLYLFILSYGSAQWLGIKNWKIILWIAAPIMLILAMLPPNNVIVSVIYPQKFWSPYIVPVDFLAIPTLLWGVGTIRKRLESR